MISLEVAPLPACKNQLASRITLPGQQRTVAAETACVDDDAVRDRSLVVSEPDSMRGVVRKKASQSDGGVGPNTPSHK